MVDSYINLSVIFLKAYEYTVQLENRTSKMPGTSWISISSSTSGKKSDKIRPKDWVGAW